uniref:Uncharacterized protein n=1 Tax=Equus caballus TaxID=9796 RepID=A0A9L0RML8_HORSE
MVQPLWKTVWCFLKKLKIKLTYDPAIPLLSMYPRELKAGSQRDICTPMFTAALFMTTEGLGATQLSTDGWINKTWYIHTMEYYSALKRQEILTYATTQMNLEAITPNEINQDKYSTMPLI